MNGKKSWVFTLAIVSAALVCAPTASAQDPNDEPARGGAESPAIATQPYLGLGVGPLHPALTAQLPDITGKGRGVLVEHVMKESPAAKAGLQQHDILVSYDKQELYSPEQLVKLVRNDESGREVVLAYVRAGKEYETTARLGEAPAQEPVRNRTAFRAPREFRPDSPAAPRQRQRVEQRERERQNDPRRWATFKSMTITKVGDGQYRAEIDFRDKDDKILHRDYVGTREEIRKAIEEDKALPDDEREHLLRSLDQQTPPVLRFAPPRSLRDLFDFDRERFDWPNLDF